MEKTQFIRTFFNSLNSVNINYFVFGSYRSLPYDTGNSDIDIVVKEEEMNKAASILCKIAIDGNITLSSYYENSTSKFFRLLTETWGIQIDFFYKGFCYRGVIYFPYERIQKDIKIHNSIVRVLDEQRGYYIDYFKEAIHNGFVKDKYVKSLLDTLNENYENTILEIEELFGGKVAQTIATNKSISGLKKAANPLQKQLRRQVLNNHFSTVLKDRLQVIRRFFSPRPGYVIVVEGTDGSGKSTIINQISPILNESFHNFVFYTHLRPKAIPDLGVLLGKKKAQEIDYVNSDPHKLPQSGFCGSLIRWSYYMIDYTIGYLIKIWPQIHSKSKVFIFDRYYYDYYFDPKRSRINLPSFILHFGEKLIANPDLILCLGGDPSIIYSRKPETSLEEVSRQTNYLKEFCKKRKNAVFIDTTSDLDQSVSQAMKSIRNVMSKRFAFSLN